jgi:TRAP-type mannitol/chloroaromatic compound transport system permease small subunit
MRHLLGFARGIDRLNDAIYTVIRWLTLAMIMVGAVNALARYLTKFTGVSFASNAYLDIQWYMFSLIFLLGAAAGLRQEMHVRVDVLYERLTPRARAWIDVAGTVLFLLPFCATMLVTSWPAVHNSWLVREGSPDPGGLIRYPIKTVLLVCFVLLFLQGISQVITRVAALRGISPLDAKPHEPGAPHAAHHVKAI